MNEHWPTLVFEDGDGDLCRCDCGEQGFDFKQGREWFASHVLAAATSTPEPEIEQPNEAQDRLYNAGYAAGQRAITDAMLAWLDDGPDQGDNEFMWKSAVRSQLHEQEQKEEGHDGQDMDRHEASLPHRLPRL